MPEVTQQGWKPGDGKCAECTLRKPLISGIPGRILRRKWEWRPWSWAALPSAPGPRGRSRESWWEGERLQRHGDGEEALRAG